MKGCYVYFCDKPLAEHFKRQMATFEPTPDATQQTFSTVILRIKHDVNDDAKFVVKASGDSMLPKIKDGDLCVFRANVTGTQNGKILLVQHNQYDPDYSRTYTIKEYSSVKSYDADDQWHHEKVTLNPLNKAYDPIPLSTPEAEEFRVISEFVGVVE